MQYLQGVSLSRSVWLQSAYLSTRYQTLVALGVAGWKYHFDVNNTHVPKIQVVLCVNVGIERCLVF